MEGMRLHEAVDIVYDREDMEERDIQERIYRYYLAHNIFTDELIPESV